MVSREVQELVRGITRKFDFGEYEMAAYMTVLENGELTASEIGTRTDIPQTRVYDTVRDLESRGVVDIEETRPMRVIAVDPERAFDSVESTVTEIVDELRSRYSEPVWDGEAATLVRSRTSVLRYLDEIAELAEFELTLSLTPGLMSRMEKKLRARRQAGVHVAVLLSPARDVPDGDAFDYDAVANQVRVRRGVTSPIVAVADGGTSLFATREVLYDEESSYGAIFTRSMMGFLVYEFFDTMLWSTAEPLVEADSGPTFPRRYASVRKCIRDLRAADGVFRATVDGLDVLTGDPRRVDGTVVDTTFEGPGGVVSLTLEGEEESEEVTVGGRVASLEDVETREIRVERVE
jgi:sugar-specific transcriptional regulator TrmB